MKITDKSFEQREIPTEKLDFGQHFTDEYMIEAVFEASEKYRLVEEYGPYSFTVREDGRLYAKWGFCGRDNAMSWFLSFGDKVEILAPEDFKKDYIERMKKALSKYEK